MSRGIPPHTRSIGSTLHHVFVLPMPANAGNTKSRVRKARKKTPKKGSGANKRKSAARALKPKLTDEQKREIRRVRAAEERQRRKESVSAGIARTLPSPAKPAAPTAPRGTDSHGKPNPQISIAFPETRSPSNRTSPSLLPAHQAQRTLATHRPLTHTHARPGAWPGMDGSKI